MDIYPIILLICFIGIFIGAIVSFFVPEELKPLKKYFILTQKIIIALILIAIVYFTQLNFIYTIILFIIIGFLLSFENYTKYLYFASPIALYISQSNQQFMLIESFLIFFWSFIIAPIHVEKYEKNEKFKKSKIKMKKELFYNNIWFLIIGLLIWLVFYFTV
jgi:hypothetical protein